MPSKPTSTQGSIRYINQRQSFISRACATIPLWRKPAAFSRIGLILFTVSGMSFVQSAMALGPKADSPETPSTKTQADSKTQTTSKAQEIPLTPFTLSYSASYAGLPFNGNATRTLTQLEGNRFELTMKASGLLMKLEEQSRFTWSPDCRVSTDSYRYTRKTLGKKKEHTIKFDHAKHQAHYKSKKSDTVYEIPPYLGDRLTEQLILRCKLQQVKRPAIDQQFVIDIARKGNVVSHTFIYRGKTALETETKIYNTAIIERIHKDPERKTTLWFDIDNQYTLVKVSQLDDGKQYTISLKIPKSENVDSELDDDDF